MIRGKLILLPFAIAGVLVGIASLGRRDASCRGAEVAPVSAAAAPSDPYGGGVSGEVVSGAEAIQAEDSDSDALKKVRQAARDLVQAEFPGSKTDGVFTLPLARGDELFIAGVDTKLSDGKRVTVDLLVRRYVRKNNGVYWKAERFGRDGKAQEIITREATEK